MALLPMKSMLRPHNPAWYALAYEGIARVRNQKFRQRQKTLFYMTNFNLTPTLIQASIVVMLNNPTFYYSANVNLNHHDD